MRGGCPNKSALKNNNEYCRFYFFFDISLQVKLTNNVLWFLF
jgi:hypothetical protein